VKCIYCGTDSKYTERSDGRCHTCSKTFAFEPKKGDRFTDTGFKSAIDAVSADGHVRWGVEHLYYELCRRLVRRGWWKIWSLLGGSRPAFARLDQATFDGLWRRWVDAHGNPDGLIVRKRDPVVSKPREADIGDYSFDRAVICDRARTVDLLIANNFHFENSCAVLSIGGYPKGPFETVRTMLKRNPKLQVFALHDASIPGCVMAHTLADDPLWFKGQAPVTDVGLRPRQAGPFRGLFLPPPYGSGAGPSQGISADEQRWLGSYVLELAAIRPEQVLKRLFRAINRKEESSSGFGDPGSGSSSGDSGGGGGGGGDSNVHKDEQSFSSDAADSDGGADSFG
jgi:hypothetical protein